MTQLNIDKAKITIIIKGCYLGVSFRKVYG